MDDEKAWDGILTQFGAGNSVAPIEGWSWLPHDIWVRPGSGGGRGAGFPFVPFMVTELRIPRPCVDFPQARNSLTVRSCGTGDVHDGGPTDTFPWRWHEDPGGGEGFPDRVREIGACPPPGHLNFRTPRFSHWKSGMCNIYPKGALG